MSFFAELLAGATSGLGKGIVDQADYNDKLEAQRALLQEKQQAALEMQRQRAEDKAFQIQLAADAKASNGRGSGGDNIVDRIFAADTPEKRQQALGLVEAFGGVNAAKAVADKVYGAPMMQERSYETIDALGDGTGAGVTSVREKSAYIAEKGAQELQRLYALFANKGDTKGNAQGEDQYMSNDLREQGLVEALRKGKPLDQASAYASQVGDPATYNKDLTNAERVRASERNAALRADTTETAADARHKANQVRDLEKQVIDLVKITGDKMRYSKDAIKTAQDMLPIKQAELAALKGNDKPAETQKQSSSYTVTGTTAPKVQDSLARFSQLQKR